MVVAASRQLVAVVSRQWLFWMGPADWSGESGRRLRAWIGSAFVRKRPGVAADRMAARRRKAANGRVDCWNVLEYEHNSCQVVKHRPKARDEIRRTVRIHGLGA